MASTKTISSEVRLFKRLVISRWDLSYARRFAELMLASTDESLTRGLNMAMIVSYWRPWLSSNKGKDEAESVLPERFLRILEPEEKALHKRLGVLRNQVMAHSDAAPHGVKVWVEMEGSEKLASPAGWNPFVPLPRPEIEMVLSMVDKLLERVMEEELRIQADLPIGQY